MTIDPEAIRREALAYPGHFRTLFIASVDREGMPHASYAPFVAFDGDYYVYISDTVQRTRNFMDTGRAGILFADDERDTVNPFARRRLSFQCQAEEIPHGTEPHRQVVRCFHESFGKYFKPLEELADFHLFCLHPIRGLYVKGFGLAFALEGVGLSEIRHLTGQGHRRRDGQPLPDPAAL
ncbi:heme iron utilization protein [Methylomarinovum caldicuralii]|uniref:Heme iron utilization protein n=1 Tax=Methylomarinovum caldicuralii TaxID=438856 RepID=A0AAU9CI78_9GAMM|nr:pyridoxamine 5'-phosphate oxidase family protein [Methylomarinovum caldicuralii]BCX81301.1 heme iron utilization protein [Methylomarinovum caldicuralii]